MIAHARVRRIAVICLAAAFRVLPAQQEIPQDKARVAYAVRADLSKLTDLERSYFAAHKRYTDDIKALNFFPASGAQITVSYASARTFSASASHVRLAPFICFSIVSSPAADSPADKPFCTDSRYGTAASALARGGVQAEPPDAPVPIRGSPPAPAPAPANVTPVTTGSVERAVPAPDVLSVARFAEQLRRVANAPRDSIVVVVQFAVKDARYDPSRGVLEIALEPVSLPLVTPQLPDTGSVRPALACHTRPAFVCGQAGLTYIARGLWRVPPSKAPDREVLRSGLTVQARFQLGRRDDTPEPSLTLLALLLRSNGVTLSRWEAAQGH